MSTYRIVRVFRHARHAKRTIDTGLTLAQAEERLLSPEASSETSSQPGTMGPWKDKIEEEV